MILLIVQMVYLSLTCLLTETAEKFKFAMLLYSVNSWKLPVDTFPKGTEHPKSYVQIMLNRFNIMLVYLHGLHESKLVCSLCLL